MAPLVLEGETLGEKHRYYNKLLKDKTSQDLPQEIQEINYDEPDIDNLFKIDIASKNKNVEYIIEVLKCEDMLYVSRALKQSLWLITDKAYTHIINPNYLYNQLLPQMTSKAGNKLVLSIRLNLKDEKRVEEFYIFYKEKKQMETAFKWLPNCSSIFIENEMEKHAKDIPHNIILRLCEQSFSVLEICARKKEEYDMRSLISKSTFLLNHFPEKFLGIINGLDTYSIPTFNNKATQKIMKKCPDIILNNFEKYARKINVPTFVKCLKPEEIKDFLIKQLENKKLKAWFTFETLKHFVSRMPSEGRFDFIKRTYIEKTHHNEVEAYARHDEELFDSCLMKCSASRANVPQSSNANIYRWYRFATFSTAFTDLKKLIRVESNPSERNEIFTVLMICARQNQQNIQSILEYYREKHINEPFKFKSHFINIVLNRSNPHRFDDKTWSILNDILCSMEVYSESENNVQSCLNHIIVYKVLNNEKIPDIVEKKFEFNSLKAFQSKLNNEENNKVFNYLYQHIVNKIQNITVNTDTDFREFKKYLMNVLNLLVDWKKDILDYEIVLEKIRELVKIKLNKCWNEDMSDIYNIKKSWRKHMYRESLLLQPTQETYINALKHGPHIIEACKGKIYQNETVVFRKLLNKLRIYWPKSLANASEDIYFDQLNDNTKHKISVQGLCILLSQKELIKLIKKFKPDDPKINWGKTDELTLSIQKKFARYMHLARPQLPIEIVLLYARGDYLQYALPSVQSIFFNTSIKRSLEHIPTLLDAPVSLQKHGLKFAVAKLNTDVFLKTCLNTWKSTKNASIRANVFKLVFDLLCKEHDETKIEEIWFVLNTFIESLSLEENKNIYVTLGQAEKVPDIVKQSYCIKSYRYLKSLPPKANCDKIIEDVIIAMNDIMESLNVEFVAEVINDCFEKKIIQEYYLSKLISTCLLSTKSELDQMQKFERIFVPMVSKYLAFIKSREINKYFLKYDFNDILFNLLKNVENIVLEKNMITPIKLFNDIHSQLEKYLSNEDFYVLIITWKLASEYMKVIDQYRWEAVDTEKDDLKWNIIHLKCAPVFGTFCMKQLKEEINKYFPTIYRFFSKALKTLFETFNFSHKVQLAVLKAIQMEADVVEGQLLVLKMLPRYLHNSEDKEERSQINKIYSSYPSAEVRMTYQMILQQIGTYEE